MHGTNGKKSKLSVREKMAMTASAAGAIAVTTADAAVIAVDNSPIYQSAYNGDGDIINWDVDGDGGADFQMWVRSSSFYSSTFNSNTERVSGNFYGIVNFASAGRFGTQLNGRGLVGIGNPNRAHAIQESFVVGPSLQGGYQWGNDGVKYRSAARVDTSFFSSRFFSRTGPSSSNTVTVSSNFGGNVNSGPGIDFTNFVDGDNLLGFRFESDGQIHYGWAEVQINGADITISRWAYESVAGEGIHATSVVPLPGSLALLATGAAGLLSFRGRRRADTTTSS